MDEKHFIKNEFYVSVMLQQLMVKNDLHGWSYGFSDSVKCGGWTYYFDDIDTGEIVISRYLIHAKNTTLNDIKDVILHEIAHAIDKCQNNHNKKWKAIAKSLGCKKLGPYCKNFHIPITKFKYVYKCSNGCVAAENKKCKKRIKCKKHKILMKLFENKKYKYLKKRKTVMCLID